MMSSDLYNQIVTMLCGAMKKANKLESINEKKKLYHEYLNNNIEFLDTDEKINIDSDEIEALIADNFLNISIKQPAIFEDEGYVPWLENVKKDISWDFYNRYERYLLEIKKWKPKSISNIKNSSDIILDHIANPKNGKFFGKKGLVIGDIQSGKTANYTAVINKAIDCGYKIIIVLAGLTKDLRNQTQKRLDSEVLGYETRTNGKGKTIGVGLIKPLNVEGLTYADEAKDYGDMKKYFSSHTLDEKLNPIVAIVKKNVNVLKHLLDFLSTSQGYCYTNNKLDIPVLIIDDEVDQASVDTKNGQEIENASTINRMIRTILSKLNRYSYIGYTATPFANVFINPDKENDIYPKDFILCIPPEDDYCGIKEYFGVDIINDDYEDQSSDHIQDLFINIKDYNDLFSDNKVSVTTDAVKITGSLKEAILSFIIASSIKKSRGIGGYNSMLIHIARYKNPSNTLKPIITKYVGELYVNLKYNYNKEIKKYKKLWEMNFRSVSKERLRDEFNDVWENIEKHLLPTIESSMNNIVVLNGDSGDFLDYSPSQIGDYIVIGGDKLSRGLTLEGLVVSYYYRKTKTYDTLLQMGRWFGFRRGWIDVCRIYSNVDFINDFIIVGKVLQKFKCDIEEMYIQKLNPREVGQRIMYSPNLIPTARNKMRETAKIKISFSNEIQQIITFKRNFVADNLKLTIEFIKSLGKGEIRSNNKVVFKNITANTIIDYLEKYKECSIYEYGHISIQNWINYISNLNKDGDLISWTVVLNSLSSIKKDYDNSIKIGDYLIYKPTRTLRDDGDPLNFTFYTIKTLIDPTDFAEFFDPKSKEYENINHYDPSKEYPGFDCKHAILSIYVVDLFEKILTSEFNPKTNKRKAIKGKIIQDGKSMCAPAIWFPKARDYEKSATIYYVSKDYLENERKNNDYNDEDIGGDENA